MDRFLSSALNVGKEVAGPLKSWIEGLDLALLVIVMLVIAAAYVFRKPLTGLVMRILLATARALRLEVPEKVQKEIFPAVQALLFSLILIIGLEVLQLPEILANTAE